VPARPTDLETPIETERRDRVSASVRRAALARDPTVQPASLNRRKPTQPATHTDDEPGPIPERSAAPPPTHPPSGASEHRIAGTPTAADQLRRAREARGLSIDDIVRRTKISRSILQTLETMDVAHLPAPIYTRGFVMSYAREVGLDPAATAASYLAAAGQAATFRPDPRAPVTLAPRPPVRNDPVAAATRVVPAGLFGWVVTAACVVGLAAYVWSSGYRNDVPPRAPAAAAATPAASAPASADVVEAASRPDAVAGAPTRAPAPDRFRIELQARGPCWVSATVDGQPLLARVLQAGERRAFDVTEAVTLRVGEPGALRYTIDGQEGRPLGRAGQPVTVRMTRENARTFLLF
jgi:hypothetical protein